MIGAFGSACRNPMRKRFHDFNHHVGVRAGSLWRSAGIEALVLSLTGFICLNCPGSDIRPEQ
jgi:hypothetical protein